MVAQDKYDVLMVGVGGQGIILASDILAEVAVLAGYDVKKSDALGMAQRGGSVVSNIRIAMKVFSPLIKRGEADILVAFEKLEAARWAGYLKTGGIAIINDQSILPLSVSSGAEVYPSDNVIRGILQERTKSIFFIKGLTLVSGVGNIRALNILLLGFLSEFLPIDREIWNKTLKWKIPAKFLETNLLAFEKGREVARDMMTREVAL